MDSFIKTLQTLGFGRIIILGLLSVGTIIAIFYFTTRLASPQMSLLYGDLDSGDSSAIVGKLETMNVSYELSPAGNILYVPSNDVARLRLLMAEEGLPSGGSLGYEIFDDVNALSSTNFMQNINHLRALEGELSRTIRTIKQIQGARVHLVLPKRELFAREKTKPTASVILKIPGNRTIAPQKISAIQHLVAAAVPELDPKNVSIVDDKGNLLAKGTEEENANLQFTRSEGLTREYEHELVQKIEELLSRTVGFGNVKAQVRADMDFDQITENSEIYDPEGQVVRSTQVVEEGEEMSDGGGSSEVSIAGNLPNAGGSGAGNGPSGSGSSSNRVEEVTNYEISKTTRLHVKEVGNVNRLSVAVLINQKTSRNEAGEVTYEPRSEDEIGQIRALVESAIGYEENRGDKIEVMNMPFVDSFNTTEDLEEPSLLLDFTKGDIFKVVELFVLGIVTILIILLVVKPIVSQIFLRNNVIVEAERSALLTGPDHKGEDFDDMGGGNGETSTAVVTSSRGKEQAAEIEKIIANNQAEGQMRVTSLKKVGKLVEDNTEEAASIIRNWVNDRKEA